MTLRFLPQAICGQTACCSLREGLEGKQFGWDEMTGLYLVMSCLTSS